MIVTEPPVVAPVRASMVKPETRGRASASVLENEGEDNHETPK